MSKLLKSGFIFSALTIASRSLGLVRDVLIAVLLGVSPGTDVFFVALSFSQMLRGLALEGPVLQTMVSSFTRQTLGAGMRRAAMLGASMSGLVLLGATALLLIAFVVPNGLVALIGSGFLFDPIRNELARAWLPLAFCYLLPILLVGIMVALQNSRDHFAGTAITPIIFNICIIAALWWGASGFNEQVAYPLVLLSIPLAGVMQYGFHCWRSVSCGVYMHPRVNTRDPELRRLLILLVPALFTILVTQASTITNNIIGSFLPIGSLSWINYANRVAILPVGIVGIALVTVLVPTLSRIDVEREKERFQSLLRGGMHFLLLFGIPAAAGVCVLAKPIALTLFQYGALELEDAQRIAWVLMALSFSIPVSMLASLFVAAFFASRAPSVPLRVSLLLLPVGLVIKLLFVVCLTHFGLPYVGLAIGVSVSAWVNVFLLWRGLWKRGVHLAPQASTYVTALRVLVAFCLMVAALLLASDTDWEHAAWHVRLLNLAADCIGGALVYLSVLWLLGERVSRALLRDT